MYLQGSENLLLLRDLPEHQAVYIRMNGSVNDREETVAQFTDRVAAQIRRDPRRYTIVDFRFNRGGDYTLVMPLVRAIAGRYLRTDGYI